MGKYTIEELDILVDNIDMSKDEIKAAIEAKGVTVGDAQLNEFPEKIMMINTSGKTEIELTDTINENIVKEYTPNEGEVYSKATITVNVPQPTIEQSKSVSITSNGNTIVDPTEGNDAMKQVTVNVSVPSDQKPEESLVQTLDENKEYTFTPTEGSVYSNATITVNVPQPTIEDNKSQSISTNGQVIIEPTEGNDAMKQVTVNVNVPSAYEFNEGDNLWDAGASIKLWNDKPSEVTVFIDNNEYTEQNYQVNTTGIYNVRFEGKPTTLSNFMRFSSPFLQRVKFNIDTSAVTTFYRAFLNTYIYNNDLVIDCSSATTIDSIFKQSTSINKVTFVNTDKVNVFNYAFQSSNIKIVEGIDFSSLTNATLFASGSSIERMIVQGTISFDVNKQNILPGRQLDYDSIKSILTAGSNRTSSAPQKTMDFSLTTGSPSEVENTSEIQTLVSKCTAKGWTIQNLNFV